MNHTSLFHRRRWVLPALAVLAAGTGLLGGCAQGVVADGSLLARTDAVLRAGQPGAVRLTIAPETLVTGDTLSARIESRLAGHLHIFQVGTDGKTLTLVFPNEHDMANTVRAGETLSLPRPQWRLRARGPAGVGYLVAVLTEQPQAISTLAKAAGDGRYQIEGGFAASMATLKEVAPR